ncbi:MAG: NAD(P)-binding protein [Candidatus Woesearchaeota archaeon]
MSRTPQLESMSELSRRLRIFAVLFVSLLAFGTLMFMFLENLTFANAILRTFETLAFMFNEDAGAARSLEIFLAIVGVFTVWWILWSVFDIVFGENFNTIISDLRVKRRLKHMKGHYIIAGGGRVGEELAKRLVDLKIPCVIIEKSAKQVSLIRKDGIPVLQGDVTDREMLFKTNITGAKALILALPETETNILVTLVAKEIAPAVPIFARADTSEFVDVMLKAGVKRVIVPEIAAAEQLLKELQD